MSEQRTPDALSTRQENELICERLLRWKRANDPRDGAQEWFDTPYGDDGAQWHAVYTPSFDTWAEAGRIVDALNERLVAVELSVAKWPDGEVRAGVHLLPYVEDSGKPLIQLHGLVMPGPLAIRAAALAYIKGSKS